MKKVAKKKRPTAAIGPDRYTWIGKSVPKPDSMEKALGATQYAGDMQMLGMLHARILWAGVPHAVIRSIDTIAAKKVTGVRSVLTAAAMTYVAATVAAIWTLVYWLWRLGLIGGSSRD